MLALSTQLHNETDLLIGFDVGRRACALPRLRARKTRRVKLSPILSCCRPPAPPKWHIRVLIKGVFCGILLHPYHDLIFMTRIVFKYETAQNGYVYFCVEGVREKRGVPDYLRRLKVIGLITGRNSSWRKRSVVRIAQINLRENEDQNLVAPYVVKHDNNSLPLREGAEVSDGSNAAVSPPQEESNREVSAGSTAAASPPQEESSREFLAGSSSATASPPQEESRKEVSAGSSSVTASPPQEESSKEVSAGSSSATTSPPQEESNTVINSGENKTERIYQLLALRRKHKIDVSPPLPSTSTSTSTSPHPNNLLPNSTHLSLLLYLAIAIVALPHLYIKFLL